MKDDAVSVAPKIHKILFENDEVRVLDVVVKPHEKAQLHSHPKNVVYALSSGMLRFTQTNGTIKDVEIAKGGVSYSDGGYHIVENIGNTTVKALQVELKK